MNRMVDSLYIYLLLFVIAALIFSLIMLFKSQRNSLRNIQLISDKLGQILDKDTDEKLMVFTDDKVLTQLLTQINRVLEDRQRINVEYRRSEMAAKRMLSNISHDIKTPLTVILGYLEMMMLNAKDDVAMLKKVENKAKQLMDLIQRFFTLAKIEAGDTEVTTTRININEVCKENILDFYNLLHEKGFNVDIHIPEEAVYVYGNEDAFNRILFNLISNAIHHGQEGNYLGVVLRYDTAFAWIDIVDHGKGIETSLASKVFDRLYTMDDSRNSKLGGSGLGLAIAKTLAEKLGGDILLESKPYEKTAFTVKLKRMNY